MFGSSTHCNVQILDTAPGIEIWIEGKLVAVYSYCQLSAKLKFGGSLQADPKKPFIDHGITINTPNGPLVIDDVATCLLDPASANSTTALANLSFLAANCGESVIPIPFECTVVFAQCPANPTPEDCGVSFVRFGVNQEITFATC